MSVFPHMLANTKGTSVHKVLTGVTLCMLLAALGPIAYTSFCEKTGREIPEKIAKFLDKFSYGIPLGIIIGSSLILPYTDYVPQPLRILNIILGIIGLILVGISIIKLKYALLIIGVLIFTISIAIAHIYAP